MNFHKEISGQHFIYTINYAAIPDWRKYGTHNVLGFAALDLRASTQFCGPSFENLITS
jgi:hypothetical protein